MKKRGQFKKLIWILALIILFSLAFIAAPTFYELFSGSTFGFFNATESINGSGIRLSAPVLFMDFNTPGENPLNLNYSNRSTGGQGTYIKDNSLYNNFGTSSGLSSPYWWMGDVAGKPFINGSLQFDGVDDYVLVEHHSSLDMYNLSFSISFWFYSRSNSARQSLVWKGSATSGGRGYNIEYRPDMSDKRLTFCINDGTSGGCKNSPFYVTVGDITNGWHHVVVSANKSSSAILYLDNVAKLTTTISGIGFINVSSPLYIGTAGGYLQGYMDEVMIFNRSLSATEVTNLYNNQSAGLRSSGLETDANLVSYWKFDELTGITAFNDVNTSINNGTITNYQTKAPVEL